MVEIGVLLGVGSLVVACGALRVAWRLSRELSQVKREQYYLEQKLKALPRQIESAVEPLRVHAALLARGRHVSDDLIRTGRLYHEISTEDVSQLISEHANGGNLLFLDVRTSGEFATRRLPGATLLPVEELEMRYRTEVPLTAEKIVVYCASGDRSRLACDFLSRHDYGNVYYMKNGLQEWHGLVEGQQQGSLIQILSKVKAVSPS